MEQLYHIEIAREETFGSYRFRSFPGAPKPPDRDRRTHGRKLGEELSKTMESIESRRVDLGIDADNLLVLEIVTDAMSRGILENMLIKFELFLVEETPIVDVEYQNRSKLVIQFADSKALEAFNHERELWEKDAQEEAVLTYAQRRELFKCIDIIRNVSRVDRIGARLKKYMDDPSLFPQGSFVVNIDVWYNGNRTQVNDIERMIKTALGTESTLLGDLIQTPSLLLGRALVNEFSLNVLLDLDIISLVDMPLTVVSTQQYDPRQLDGNPIINDNLDENAPLATVLDSGVFTANPLLSTVIVAEEDFNNTEHTTSDLNGHGTGVAGIVVYGDLRPSLDSKVFTPLVRVCNAKIMHNENGNACFPVEKRPELIVKEAIEYFHREYNCRIFNLSAGDASRPYNNGRQFAWAEMLDQLSRDLDIVIVVSAGNVSDPQIPDFDSRQSLEDGCRNQLFLPEHRLIDPATSALSVTVGSISRFAEPEVTPHRSVRLSVGGKDSSSVFTRIGRGVNKMIKPELVDYGGNYALHQVTRGNSWWHRNDRALSEITLHNANDKLFRFDCGTSISAPYVTHIAARIERALEKQIGDKPSANLIRAFLVNSAGYSPEMVEYANQSADPLYTGKGNPKQDRKLRLMGFGRTSDSILYSSQNQVTLFAEDSLDLRSFHLYKIPVPKEFPLVRADKRIAISLAYNPVTRLSRKEYLAASLWFEVFRKIDERTLLQYKAKKESSDEDAEAFLDKLPDTHKVDFFPGATEIDKSTLQQRVWAKNRLGGRDLVWNIDEPYIMVLVTGRELFRHAEQERAQPYSLVITFSYSGEEDIRLYENLRNNVRLRERHAERIRVPIRS